MPVPRVVVLVKLKVEVAADLEAGHRVPVNRVGGAVHVALRLWRGTGAEDGGPLAFFQADWSAVCLAW